MNTLTTEKKSELMTQSLMCMEVGVHLGGVGGFNMIKRLDMEFSKNLCQQEREERVNCIHIGYRFVVTVAEHFQRDLPLITSLRIYRQRSLEHSHGPILACLLYCFTSVTTENSPNCALMVPGVEQQQETRNTE